MSELVVVYQVANVADCCGALSAVETCHSWAEATDLAEAYPLGPEYEVEVRPRIGVRVGNDIYLFPGECEMVPAPQEEVASDE